MGNRKQPNTEVSSCHRSQTGNVAKTIKATKEDPKRDNAAKKEECEVRPLRKCAQCAYKNKNHKEAHIFLFGRFTMP